MGQSPFKNDADQDPQQREQPDQKTQTSPSEDTPTADGGQASGKEER